MDTRLDGVTDEKHLRGRAVVGAEAAGLGGAGTGLLAAAASGGALFGALSLGMKRNIGSPTRVMVLGSVTWHVLMLVLALSLPLWGFALVLVAWGFSGGLTFVAMVVGLLRAAPVEFRGRVMGIRTLGIYGLPIGLLVGGWKGPLTRRLSIAPAKWFARD